jgi:hypothetical protein
MVLKMMVLRMAKMVEGIMWDLGILIVVLSVVPMGLC